MKKTNLRINNIFIFENNKNYYLSEIDDLSQWKKHKVSEKSKTKKKKQDKIIKFTYETI